MKKFLKQSFGFAKVQPRKAKMCDSSSSLLVNLSVDLGVKDSGCQTVNAKHRLGGCKDVKYKLSAVVWHYLPGDAFCYRPLFEYYDCTVL